MRARIPGKINQVQESILRTSSGEVVQHADLSRAACLNDPDIEERAESVTLARAALAGDQAALDEFHNRAGLVLPEVTEYRYKREVRLSTVDEWVLNEEGLSTHAEAHVAFLARARGDYDETAIDAAELVAWILSPDGQTALARRGISVSISEKPIPHAGSGSLRAEHLPCIIDRLEIALTGLLGAMPEFKGDLPLVEQLGTEMASLREAARETCRLAKVPWSSTFEQERWASWTNSLKDLVTSNG